MHRFVVSWSPLIVWLIARIGMAIMCCASAHLFLQDCTSHWIRTLLAQAYESIWLAASSDVNLCLCAGPCVSLQSIQYCFFIAIIGSQPLQISSLIFWSIEWSIHRLNTSFTEWSIQWLVDKTNSWLIEFCNDWWDDWSDDMLAAASNFFLTFLLAQCMAWVCSRFILNWCEHRKSTAPILQEANKPPN